MKSKQQPKGVLVEKLSPQEISTEIVAVSLLKTSHFLKPLFQILLNQNFFLFISGSSYKRPIVRVFKRRLTSGGIFNNRFLFKNNRLLFSLLFSGNFVGGQGFDGGDKVVMGDPPVHPLGKTLIVPLGVVSIL